MNTIRIVKLRELVKCMKLLILIVIGIIIDILNQLYHILI